MLSELSILDQEPDFERLFRSPVLQSASNCNLLDCLHDIHQRWRFSKTEQACANYRSNLTRKWDTEYFDPGNANSVHIDIKAIIRRIMQDDNDALILCHYHPEGTTHPSEADLRTTRTIAQISRTLGVDLVDHIIFGMTPLFSFRRAHYL